MNHLSRWKLRRIDVPRTALLPIRSGRSSNNIKATSGGWLERLRFAAVLAGGLWALFIYLAHERDQKQLAIDAQRHSNEQALKLANTEIESKRVSLEQQRLALRLSEIAASSERERSQLSLEQQRLAVDQSKSTAKYQLDRERLSTTLMEIERGLKQVELADAQYGRILGSNALQIKCLPKKNSYFVSLDSVVQNTSEKKEVEVSWELRSAYLGTPRERSPQLPYMARINEPPDAYTNTKSTGPIQWDVVGNVGYIYPGTKAQSTLTKTAFHFEENGLLTKVIRPRDKAQSTSTYVVHAPAGHWVALVLRLGVDGATSGEGVFRFAQWRILPDCSVGEAAQDTQDRAQPRGS